MNPCVVGVDGKRARLLILDLDANLICGVDFSRTSLREACEQARGVAGFDVRALVVGTEDQDFLNRELADVFNCPESRISREHYYRIAHAGGLTGRPGILLCVDHEASCYGRTEAGEEWLAGGWGHLTSNEGSIHWLGMEGLRVGLGMESPDLTRSIEAVIGTTDTSELMSRLYLDGLTRDEVTRVAGALLSASQNGDPVATAVVRHGMKELAETALSVARHLNMTAPEVAVSGMLVEAGDVVLRPLSEELRVRVKGSRTTPPELPPVMGACLLALQAVYDRVPEGILRRLSLAARQARD